MVRLRLHYLFFLSIMLGMITRSKYMLSVQEVRSMLQDRRLAKVAEATGLSTQTLWRIREGTQENVQVRTLEKISDYLESKK